MKKVLIIDDDRSAVQTLVFQLKGEGFDVASAENGVDGLEKMKEFKPDVVVTELVLLKRDGFEVLGELKKERATAAVPVVVFSKLGHADDIKEAKRLGAAEYFVKGETTLKTVVEKVKSLR